jgi:uncharacterized protein YegJ (DUF2314 family)
VVGWLRFHAWLPFGYEPTAVRTRDDSHPTLIRLRPGRKMWYASSRHGNRILSPYPELPNDATTQAHPAPMPKPDRNKRTAGNTRANARAERNRAKRAGGLPPPAVAVVPDDDPKLAAAAAEANRRFGEFLTAFQQRKPGDTFAVKVPFSDDYGREFMWVRVAAVDDSFIVGRLDNRPAYVQAVRAGQKVRVPRTGLNDWLIVRGGELLGGFTLKVVQERATDEGEAA